MRSMRWDLFSVIWGPCKRYAVTLTRMPVHNCLPGPHLAASVTGSAQWSPLSLPISAQTHSTLVHSCNKHISCACTVPLSAAYVCMGWSSPRSGFASRRQSTSVTESCLVMLARYLPWCTFTEGSCLLKMDPPHIEHIECMPDKTLGNPLHQEAYPWVATWSPCSVAVVTLS